MIRACVRRLDANNLVKRMFTRLTRKSHANGFPHANLPLNRGVQPQIPETRVPALLFARSIRLAMPNEIRAAATR
jgi:hypothetical protein